MHGHLESFCLVAAALAVTTTLAAVSPAASFRADDAPRAAAATAAAAPRGDRALPLPAPREIVLSGTVTAADKGTYQEHPFDLPAGTTRIDVAFSYDNQRDGTELEIGLFDPQRFRGTSRFSKARFYLTEFEATPSYAVGPLPAGTWRLSLGIPSVKAGTSGGWKAIIRLSSEPTPREGFAGVLKDAPGWYVGDLHGHTMHSDAFGCEDPGTPGVKRGCQPWEVVEAARPDFRRMLLNCDCSVSQGGYNTVMEILQARAVSQTPAVIVPFATAREQEQTLRSQALARTGLVVVLPAKNLSPASLAAAIDQALTQKNMQLPLPDLNGGPATARLLREKLNG